MVNLGKTFSIAVVFVVTLALLAVPALTPPVALADDPLPNPLTVNFTATVDEGDVFPFNMTPDGTFGSVINQFSRPWMVIYQPAANDTDCRFFNMSTAPGTISGDLSGNINFKWNRLDFNLSYLNSTDPPNTTWYVDSPDGVGLLFINGSMTDTELGDLTFVGAADLDYNSTVVSGAGIVWTVENWTEGITTAPSRVLIGELSYEYVVGTGAMTGTFSLRNYSTNPVGLEGKVNTTGTYIELAGQLVTDDEDWVTNESVLFSQFSRDPVVGGTLPNHRIVLEEMTVGREPDQDITAGDMGVDGTISLLRTGVLDVIGIGEPPQDIPLISATATRTIENNTGSNLSQFHGVAKTIVLVDMVGFCPVYDPVTCPNPGVDQQAYTAMPGYSDGYLGTGYYAGMESYVIAATHIDLTLYLSGPDYRWALLPTPLVSTVNPTEEGRGNTTEVTINGKWFWTNTSYNPLTIDFGQGITVDDANCTVVDDTQIKVNITVAGDAFVGPRAVKVTKRGVTTRDPGSFSVSGPTGNLTGNVALWRAQSAPCSTFVTGLEVSFFDPGTKNLLFPGNVVTDADGSFTIEVGNGTYDIGIKNWTCLSKMNMSVTVNVSETKVIYFPTPTEADSMYNDDMADGWDYSMVLNNLGAMKIADPDAWAANEFWRGDFNRDEMLDGWDYSSVLNNLGAFGEIFIYEHS